MLLYANEVELKEKEKLPEVKTKITASYSSFQKTSYFPFLYKSYQRDCKDVT